MVALDALAPAGSDRADGVVSESVSAGESLSEQQEFLFE